MGTNKLLRMLRGEEVNLHEVDPGLHKVRVCIGWDVPSAHSWAMILGKPVWLFPFPKFSTSRRSMIQP